MNKPTTSIERIKPIIWLIILAYIGTFFFFRWSNHTEKSRAIKTIESLLLNESLVANSYALSKSVVDLERLGFLSCATITEVGTPSRVFYNTSTAASCYSSDLVNSIRRTSINLRAINGLNYDIQFYLPIHWEAVSLELMTYLLLGSGVFVYIRRNQEQLLRNQLAESLIHISRQTAHDIRGPLTGLNLVLSTLPDMPDTQRVIIRNATNRINSIANQLLQSSIEEKSKLKLTKVPPAEKTTPTEIKSSPMSLDRSLIPALIDAVVSEKAITFSGEKNVTIEAELEESYGAFVTIDPTEFQRLLSNLINNSVEALPESGGRVRISVRLYSSKVIVTVHDNGRGIPKSVLSRIGEQGFSYGKDLNTSGSGSGLGVHAAKTTVEAAKGEFQIQSREGLSTMITMTFPKAEAPGWFIDSIDLKQVRRVAVIDDDPTVATVWKSRLSSASPPFTGEFQYFKNGNDLKIFIAKTDRQSTPTLFLVDYEIRNQNSTGLSLISELGLSNHAILVTSSYDEPDLQQRCNIMGIKLLPKSMVGHIPIES